MSFALNGTHIAGATFNNVSGNMTQVYNLHIARPLADSTPSPSMRRAVDGQRGGRGASQCHTSSNTESPWGWSREQSPPTSRRGVNPLAAISGRSHRYPQQEVSDVTNHSASRPIRHPRNTAQCAIPQHGPESSVHWQQHQVGITPSPYSVKSSQKPCTIRESDSQSRLAIRERGPPCWSSSAPGAWSRGPMMWLHGAAGAGKSAIAQMFAGNCQAMGRLGASFFFRRGHPKRGTWNGLVTTIAHQLSRAIPDLLLPLQRAVDLDPLLLSRAMPLQFERLFVQLLTNPAARQFAPVIILDGLDECADHNVHRPEPHLREIIERAETSTIFQQPVLIADKAAFDDIRNYLRNQFTRVGSNFRARGIDLGVYWPGPDTLKHLVKKSSGMSIYAVTVIRYIDDECCHPKDRLEARSPKHRSARRPVFSTHLGRPSRTSDTSYFTRSLEINNPRSADRSGGYQYPYGIPKRDLSLDIAWPPFIGRGSALPGSEMVHFNVVTILN
ncbi:hypothetical protein C8F04DRAFT_1237031 [Mycena alexandri]|uniref:Nephrocystin 3-like N-terminal domain-containing protein n=1 Tax=Mycena alexandri TaxID=1745969 RepID=A0AAD6SLP0_9AGAR|nr:hypothetical protein C8F04DRAFT_1237031 [Mycena alexandri]